MKKPGFVSFLIISLLAVAFVSCNRNTPEDQNKSIDTGASGMTHSFSTEEINGRTIERRGVEAVIWGMPAVNFDRMFQTMTSAHGGWNQILYWSHLSTWKNQL